jgi:hypothetical protein
MFHEVSLGDVYVAPIVLKALLAGALLLLCRFLLGRSGILHRLWHPALFEVALYVSLVSLLVLL